MENQTIQNQHPFNTQINVPNSVAVLVLGIVSIVMCFCYGIFGLASGIVALILAGKAKALYEEDPDLYTISSYNNMKAGRICAIIGTSLSAIYMIFWIIYFAFIGTLLTALPWDEF